MSRRSVLAAFSVPILAGSVLWVFDDARSAPVPWGSDGHRMATRAAHSILPDEMPSFFLQAQQQLEFLGPEPDQWRNGHLREMDEAWRYDHYIDLENVPPGVLAATDRFEFFTALLEAGVHRPQQTVGFLPFRILELYQRLCNGFARWRISADASSRRWIEARILNDAGILSHYVVDAAQPHHTTIHFNGWAEGAPNPRGYTHDRKFHSRFESAFVRAHVSYPDLIPGMPSRPETLGEARAAIWRHVRASHATVQRLYELEKAHGFEADLPPHPEARAFAVERLVAGAEMLAAIWWTAWVESEAMARDLERGGWTP